MLMRKIVKQIAVCVAAVVVLPTVLAYWVTSLVAGRHSAFAGWSQTWSLVPGLCGVYLRRAFYQYVLSRCGAGSCLSLGTMFSHPTASVGANVYVGAYCCLGDIALEDDVLIGSHVSIMNGCRQHGIERLDIPVREQPGEWPRITIGRDTWIGDRAVVMANVGQHCVVGAGSVVTRAVPDYAIVVGVPARIVGQRGNPKGEADWPTSAPSRRLQDAHAS
jgi:virginiamycin A acetyltransferase